MFQAIAHALQMAGIMAWEILWALILGFGLSAVTNSFDDATACWLTPSGTVELLPISETTWSAVSKTCRPARQGLCRSSTEVGR